MSYKIDFVPMDFLASKYKVSRMAIWKVLNNAGVDTTKKTGAHIATVCKNCNKPIVKTRCCFRKSLHHFCSHKCFSKWLNRKDNINQPLISRRQGLRIGRKKVSQYLFLELGMVVHHEDRNENNNNLDNLRVFASGSDHLKYHRDFSILPIWDGRSIPKNSM
jgi:hypothetical protein